MDKKTKKLLAEAKKLVRTHKPRTWVEIFLFKALRFFIKEVEKTDYKN